MGGTVSVHAGQLIIDDAEIDANALAAGNGGDLNVFAGAITLEDGGRIDANTLATGNGGNVMVLAGSLNIEGMSGVASGIDALSIPGAGGSGGAAGKLKVTVTHALDLGNGGEIDASTSTSGEGGLVTVYAGALNINDAQIVADALSTGKGGDITVHAGTLNIEDGQIAADTLSTGNGGTVNVAAGTLTLEGGGKIDAITLAGSMGGNVSIQAGSLEIVGVSGLITGIDTFSEQGAQSGQAQSAGSIEVSVTGALDITDGGQIDASTSTSGNGGNVAVHAGVLDMNDSQIVSDTVSGGASPGNGGNVTVGANEMTLYNGATIDADTLSMGAGGSVIVQAGSLYILGPTNPGVVTGINALSAAGPSGASGGHAGSIQVAVRHALEIGNGGQIDASTSTAGHGGAVIVDAGSITIGGGSEIVASTSSSGYGGQITLEAGSLNIGGSATIQATSTAGASGNAGNLSINVLRAITIQSGGEITATTFSSGEAGLVTIQAASMDINGSAATVGVSTGILDASESGLAGDSGGAARDINIDVEDALSVLGGGEITAATFTSGNGGAIGIHAGSVNIESTGEIVASTSAGGVGGEVSVQAGSMNIGGSAMIQATSAPGATGNAGSLAIDLSGGLTIQGGGAITASTSSSGNSGEVIVRANSIDIDGSGIPEGSTGIFDESDQGNGTDVGGVARNISLTVTKALALRDGGGISAETFTSGHGGNIRIEAGSVNIESQGQIVASTYSSGLGGKVSVDAQSLSIGGMGMIEATSDQTATNNGGSLVIDLSGGLTIQSGGQINASTFSPGESGNIMVQAASLDINGSGATTGVSTGILDESEPGIAGESGGAAQDIDISITDGLAVQAGGEITAATNTSGNGGNVRIRAGAVNIEGSAMIDATSQPVSMGTTATGEAGALTIDVSGGLTIQSGGEITASTESTSPTGNAGFVTVQANSMDINGSETPNSATGILDQSVQLEGATASDAPAGDIHIGVTKGLTIQGGGEITASTSTSGNGGTIGLKANILNIENRGKISVATSAGGNGGAISIKVDSTLNLESNSDISTATSGGGAGGNLAIHATSLNIGGLAMIEATSKSGAIGNAGAITIDVTGEITIQGGGKITASTFSSMNAGAVIVQADSMAIDGSATPQGVSTGIFDESEPGDEDESGGPAGDISIDVSGVLIVQGRGQVTAATYTSGNGGTITIDANTANIESGGMISAETYAGGLGGDITIQGYSTDIESTGKAANAKAAHASMIPPCALTVQGGGQISATAAKASSNDGGDLTIDASSLVIDTGGGISAATFSTGNAGDVSIQASSMDIHGVPNPSLSTGIATSSAPGATGNAGDIEVTVTGALDIENDGRIRSATNTEGHGGNVTVQAGSLDIDGAGALPGLSGFTGIDAKSELGASGDAGDLYVTVAGALTLQSGGEITASTASVGSAGRVILQAGSIVINGAAAPEGASTGIFDQSLQGIGRDSGGAADDLNVTVAGAVELDSGGQIAASTFTSGAAGKLKVQATSLDINGAGAPAGATGILDQSELGTDGDTGGAAGDLKVVVKRALTIEGAGEITAATFTSGNGGDLSIRAGSIEIDGASSSIQVESLGAGNAGKAGGITIASHQLNVENGGAVSATAQNASGGNIGVQISDSMDLSGGMIKATAGKNGGNITIDAGYLSLRERQRDQRGCGAGRGWNSYL